MKPKTIFCDIDGTLLYHHGDLHKQITEDPILLERVKETLVDWDRKGYNIILTTGRKESCRDVTVKQLAKTGIFYDQLIMGIGGGRRYLINDKKENGKKYASCFNVDRNKGLKDFSSLDIEEFAMSYFSAFEGKNISKLKSMFANSVSLRDWNVSVVGIKKVINVNKEIFDSFKNIKIRVINIHISEMTAIAEIEINLDKDKTLVTDIIEFDKNNKIKSIRAYKG